MAASCNTLRIYKVKGMLAVEGNYLRELLYGGPLSENVDRGYLGILYLSLIEMLDLKNV